MKPLLCLNQELWRLGKPRREEKRSRKKAEPPALIPSKEGIGEWAAEIAHDLNNALSPILVCVQLLKKDPPAEERQQMLETVETSVQRAADMTKQMLRCAHARRDDLHLDLLIHETAPMLRRLLSNNIVFEVSAAEDLWPVSGDAVRLSQVLLNLCLNARDAMPDGGTLTITASNIHIDKTVSRKPPGAKAGPYVLLQITDTGTGIPLELLDRIFEPFFTTKPPDRGTGLGLSSVLRIVKDHGGFLQVSSEAGRGSVFSILLPACA